MSKKIVVLAITLLMLVSLGITFINRVEAAKPIKSIHKESVKNNDRETNDDNMKSDDDREVNDDCDKCEQESKAEKISKENCNCQNEDQDNDQEQEDDD